ncbi:MAG: N-acetylmuramoyl-L-alanine amidase [Tumebacillaceae bacterium]
MNAKRVVLDPGHGGQETGISYEGVLEKDVNLAICLKLRDELVAAGVEVVMTREADADLAAARRIEIANGANADLHIEWHCDSLEDETVTGVSLWVDPSANDVVQRKIDFDVIGDVISETTGQIMMGVYEEKDQVLAQVEVPAVLIRCGFLSNREERARLIDPVFQQEQARGAAQGILYLLSPKK